MELIATLWIVIGLIIALGGCFLAGSSDEWSKEDLAFGSVFIGIIWPLALAFAVIVLPFVGLFKLGEHWKEQRDKR